MPEKDCLEMLDSEVKITYAQRQMKRIEALTTEFDKASKAAGPEYSLSYVFPFCWSLKTNRGEVQRVQFSYMAISRFNMGKLSVGGMVRLFQSEVSRSRHSRSPDS
jgi:hypothetical protein